MASAGGLFVEIIPSIAGINETVFAEIGRAAGLAGESAGKDFSLVFVDNTKGAGVESGRLLSEGIVTQARAAAQGSAAELKTGIVEGARWASTQSGLLIKDGVLAASKEAATRSGAALREGILAGAKEGTAAGVRSMTEGFSAGAKATGTESGKAIGAGIAEGTKAGSVEGAKTMSTVLVEGAKTTGATVAKILADAVQGGMAKGAELGAAEADTALSGAGKFGFLGGGVGKAGAALGAAGVLDVAYHGVRDAGDFQQNLGILQSTAGESPNNIGLVSAGIQQIASDVGYDPNELAGKGGIYAVESFGFHGAAALQVLRAAAEAAKIEGADLGSVVKGVATEMVDYNIPAANAADITSKIVAAVGESGTTFQDFSSSLHSITPIAAQMGIKFEDVAGALAVMTQHGYSADQAAQNIADTIRHLSGSLTSGQIDALAQIGVKASDLSADLGKYGLTGTMMMLQDAMIAHAKGGIVFNDSMNESKVAADNARAAYMQLSPQAKHLADELISGKIGIGEFRKEAKLLPGEMGNMALTWQTLNDKASGFSSLLKSGKPQAKDYATELKAIFGDAPSWAVAEGLLGDNTARTKDAVANLGGAAKEADGNVKGWAETQDRFNTKLDRFKGAMHDVAIALGNELLPVASKVLEVFGGMVAGIGPDGKPLAPDWFGIGSKRLLDDFMGIDKTKDPYLKGTPFNPFEEPGHADRDALDHPGPGEPGGPLGPPMPPNPLGPGQSGFVGPYIPKPGQLGYVPDYHTPPVPMSDLFRQKPGLPPRFGGDGDPGIPLDQQIQQAHGRHEWWTDTAWPWLKGLFADPANQWDFSGKTQGGSWLDGISRWVGGIFGPGSPDGPPMDYATEPSAPAGKTGPGWPKWLTDWLGSFKVGTWGKPDGPMITGDMGGGGSSLSGLDLSGALEKFKSFGTGLQDTARSAWSGVSGWFGRTKDDVTGWLSHAADDGSQKWHDFSGWLGDKSHDAWSSVSGWFGRTKDDVGGWLGNAAQDGSDKWHQFSGWLGDKSRDAWSGVSGWFGRTKDDVTGWLGHASNEGSDKWQQFSGALGDKSRDAWSTVSGWFNHTKDDVVGWLGHAADDGAAKWGKFRDDLSNIARDTWHNVSGFFGNLWQDAENLFTTGANAVIRTVNGFLDGINSVAGMLDWHINLHLNEIGGNPLLGGVPAMATGGLMPVGSGFQTNGATAIVGEGDPAWPEYVIPTDPKYRGRAGGLARSLLADLGGVAMLEGGGFVPSAADIAHHVAGDVNPGKNPPADTLLMDLISKGAGAVLNAVWPILPVDQATPLLSLLPQTVDALRAHAIDALDGHKPKGGDGSFLSVAAMSGDAKAAQDYAFAHLGQFGWGVDQWPSLLKLWNQESGWNPYAINPSSGAYGIPQSLGHGHPYDLGDFANQIQWGDAYIRDRYGNPDAAWAHEVGFNWYDNGGYLPPGVSTVVNGTGSPEPVFTGKQFDRLMDGKPTTQIEIHVHAQPGQSEAEIAAEIERRLTFLMR